MKPPQDRPVKEPRSEGRLKMSTVPQEVMRVGKTKKGGCLSLIGERE